MSNENRDFVIERLERQLKERELEVENIKTTLRDSIIREIRSDLKNDLDINNRVTKVEQKIQALNNNLNGVMDELLDQKSMIRSLRETLTISLNKKAPEVREEPVLEKAGPQVYRPAPTPVPEPVPEPVPQAPVRNDPVSQTPVFTAPVRKFVPPEPPIPASTADSNVSVRSANEPLSRHASGDRPANVNVNIRDVAQAPEPVAQPRPEPRTEYIIAENDDERNARLQSRQVPRESRESCNYIVAEEDNPDRRQCETENESVEARDDEDAVITVTRRK
ncbi:hypothetical protein V7O66_11745 [Methanolobus sp. ZRKC3]|uniref:hypothetical protein n=1 Tax=Methanolobus sp. ZRKC3 TaxID=3125786 RepID=UPI003247FA49